jgi:hypothetical protein
MTKKGTSNWHAHNTTTKRRYSAGIGMASYKGQKARTFPLLVGSVTSEQIPSKNRT